MRGDELRSQLLLFFAMFADGTRWWRAMFGGWASGTLPVYVACVPFVYMVLEKIGDAIFCAPSPTASGTQPCLLFHFANAHTHTRIRCRIGCL